MKNVIGLMKDELGEKIEEFLGLKAKTYSYLIDDGGENKKAKDTKMSVIKRKLKFNFIFIDCKLKFETDVDSV